MSMTKEELKKLVEVCWAAAHEADMVGYPRTAICIPSQVDLVRLKAFEVLLACVCPRGVQQVEHGHLRPKEPWEE